MSIGTENAPSDKSPELLFVAAAGYECQIAEAKKLGDYVAVAQYHFERGRLFSLYGRHKEALDDFDEASSRLAGTRESGLQHALLEFIDSYYDHSFRASGMIEEPNLPPTPGRSSEASSE